ncbi:MAG: SGNH/GDSL hydrolase family protein [Acidobacteriota bacterium]|nr:SGNH/GDSL hydrolase family protein [Acidobacteriota bacterium]
MTSRGARVKAPRGARRSFLCAVLIAALAFLGATTPPRASSAVDKQDAGRWIGTWAAAPQLAVPGRAQTFRNQTLRLIVHVSAGGKRVRVRLSNVFGDQPLVIGGAHVARRASGSDIDPASDRALTFGGRASTTIPARSMAVSDPIEMDVPALSDLAVSLFLPESTQATTSHSLALQTNYVSTETGDSTAAAKFPVGKTISSWPFLTGVDVAASPRGAAIVAFGSSTTDGDGSTKDANRRWPDVLAERLQEEPGGNREIGVLNEGVIGNRLLSDSGSPRQLGGPFEEVFKRLGLGLGQAGVARFRRDVLSQAGVRYVVLALGVNDILFPGSFIPSSESVSAQALIDGYRQLIARAHKKGIRVIGTTIPPFEGALFRSPPISFSTPEHERVRQEVNAWIRSGREFDAVVDLDAVVRDPSHPARLLSAYDSGDHLHVNDAGNVAQGNAVPLTLFRGVHGLKLEASGR